MTIVELSGCRANPLLSYLSGLGVARLVHEQLAPRTTSFWNGSTLCLDGDIDRDSLVEFFLEALAPTPMLSPWNGRGGFRTGKQEKGEKAVAAIFDSPSARFRRYRDAIEIGREAWGVAAKAGWIVDEKIGPKHKASFLATCRSMFPDEALDWLDTAAVIADGETTFPLLLGTGGNLGSGDLATNVMAALTELLDPERAERSRELLDHALFGDGYPKLDSTLVGQFGPGAAGSINSWTYGDAPDAVNLWSFVLAMEGALLFTSGVARRFAGSSRTATMPFTVNPSRAGYPGGEQEAVKGEFWAPRWSRHSTLPELRRIFAEGRIDWSGSHATSGIDAAKAVCSLGVDRGIHSFERFIVAERFGNMTLAVSAGSFTVRTQPAERVGLLADIDPWVERLRSRDLPAAAASALHRFDAAELDLVHDPDSARALQMVLVALAELDELGGLTDRMREYTRAPVPPLAVDTWVDVLNDDSVKWRLALAITTQTDVSERNSRQARAGRWESVARMVRRTMFDARDRWVWSSEPPEIEGVLRRSLDATLADVTIRRAVRSGDRRTSEAESAEPVVIGSGSILAFGRAKPVSLSDLRAFLARKTDDHLIAKLISAVALLDGPPKPESVTTQPEVIDPARALLAPFFVARPVECKTSDDTSAFHRFNANPAWPQQLRAGKTQAVLREASIRLRAAGHKPGLRADRVTSADPARLLASLAIPLDDAGVRMALESVCPPPIRAIRQEDDE